MWEKVKFIMSSIGGALWPFLKRFLQKEMETVLTAAAEAVKKVAADESLKDKDWTAKLSAAVAIVQTELVSKTLQVGTSMIIDAIQVEYAKFKEAK